MLHNFYTDTICKNPRRTSTSVITDETLMEPGTRKAVDKAIIMSAAAGHRLIVGETYRSRTRQHELYLAHATQLSQVGMHGYGLACDLKLMIDGKYDPNGEHYRFLEDVCRKCGLIAGADWGTTEKQHNFHDWDHVQRVPVFRQKSIMNGTWYPPEDYDPYADQVEHGVK
jgi:hypothetical protein